MVNFERQFKSAQPEAGPKPEPKPVAQPETRPKPPLLRPKPQEELVPKPPIFRPEPAPVPAPLPKPDSKPETEPKPELEPEEAPESTPDNAPNPEQEKEEELTFEQRHELRVLCIELKELAKILWSCEQDKGYYKDIQKMTEDLKSARFSSDARNIYEKLEDLSLQTISDRRVYVGHVNGLGKDFLEKILEKLYNKVSEF